MARPKVGQYRVLGPYCDGSDRWRVILVGPDGRRNVETFSGEEEAEKAAKAARRRIPGRLTLERALALYEQHLNNKGNRDSSIERTMRRLRIFHDGEVAVADVTPAQIERKYTEREEQVAVDSHRNELNETKTFWRWCVRSGFVPKSPAEEVEAHGRRKRGKMQLRRGEARTFFSATMKLAEEGDEAALAVATILVLGLRANEILERRVRDVDVGSDGVLLWIDQGKTESARRYHEVPEPVAGLLAAKAKDRKPEEWLFPAPTGSGHRRREWLWYNCRRICEAANVPVISPQGLRGTWATLTREAGISSHVVARELGHAGDAVTKRHYIAPGADARARTRELLRVVEGGVRE